MAKTVAQPYDTVVSEVIELLRAEGFGVLTDIDVRATLKSKIGGDMSRYRILGACNPSLAHKALKMEDKLGVLLPLNLRIRAQLRRLRAEFEGVSHSMRAQVFAFQA